MTASRFALEPRDVRARPMSSTAMRWSARRSRYSPAGGGETDSRKLKLVPFVRSTDASKPHRRAKSENLRRMKHFHPPQGRRTLVHPCRIARRDRFSARFGRLVKRVPECWDRPRISRPADGGQDCSADGGFLGRLTIRIHVSRGSSDRSFHSCGSAFGSTVNAHRARRLTHSPNYIRGAPPTRAGSCRFGAHSRGRNFGRFTDCFNTASCCRRARFSTARRARGRARRRTEGTARPPYQRNRSA